VPPAASLQPPLEHVYDDSVETILVQLYVSALPPTAPLPQHVPVLH
jgi:hypothetical protein